jgi:hypothetical protein
MEETLWEQVGHKDTGTKQMSLSLQRKSDITHGRHNSQLLGLVRSLTGGMKERFKSGFRNIEPKSSLIGLHLKNIYLKRKLNK